MGLITINRTGRISKRRPTPVYDRPIKSKKILLYEYDLGGVEFYIIQDRVSEIIRIFIGLFIIWMLFCFFHIAFKPI